jgi:UDP-glucuronate 4-epimerase
MILILIHCLAGGLFKNKNSMRVLITGAAGFIGSTLSDYLLATTNYTIIGLDNFSDFYSRSIKEDNLKDALNNEKFTFIEADIRSTNWQKEMGNLKIDAIIHLAAMAGVRPSIKDPILYEEVNINGTNRLLEFAKEQNIKQFVFASSSSVYGINENVPWSENDYVLKPISPYASTKVAGELIGHTYSHLYNIRFVGLRFFTVYGPRQRPDLAIHKFAKLILNDEPIKMFGDGSTRRDYTYVEDIVKGIVGALHYNESMYEIINIGNNDTINLSNLISKIENALGKKANIEHHPMQPGDVPQTYADISKAKHLLDYMPSTQIDEGLKKFVKWLSR